MELIVYWFIYLVICFLIALLGHKRRISGTASFLLSATLSPILGLILTLISPSLKNEKAYKENSDFNKGIGIASYCLSGIILLSTIYKYFTDKYGSINNTDSSNWPSIVIGIGFYILGDYLYRMDIPEKPIPQNAEPQKEISKPIIEKISKPKSKKMSIVPKKLFKKVCYAILIIIAVLIITNPSIKRFKEYRGENSYKGLSRKQNWIIFSVYEDGSREYLGIILNFITIQK